MPNVCVNGCPERNWTVLLFINSLKQSEIMCWVGKSLRLEAEKDIPIFKIMDPDLCSYYRDFQYILNQEHYTFLDFPNVFNEINKGFHSYDITKCSVTRSCYKNRFVSSNGEVLDCYSGNSIKVEGIIPKGSFYYVNECGEYVSDTIMLTKIID